MTDHPSWGLFPTAEKQTAFSIEDRLSSLPKVPSPLLPRGLGRSYGDSCLNAHGTLLTSNRLNHFISFDPNAGILRCEAGVSFDDILQVIVPKGWFLPVTPGTKFITVGGAIANDIHGKNHHQAGNFGHHVGRFELLRSTGERLICSRSENSNTFYATIGGLGLTGFITWAEFQLTKIPSSYIAQEQIQFSSLEEFFRLSQESESTHEYTVSWIDCVRSSQNLRGIFIRGNFDSTRTDLVCHKSTSLKTVPFFFPEWALNSYSIKAFNQLYYHKNIAKVRKGSVHYDPFFYPLDSIHHWNRIYGKRGFLQYQCVVPYKNDQGSALNEIFRILQRTQMGSFLAVLKTFGGKNSEGMMSFPQEGVTLALDFPNRGQKLFDALETCDEIVKSVRGKVYPAKDARMSKSSFEAFFPRLSEFEKHLDPQFSSSFWRRVR